MLQIRAALRSATAVCSYFYTYGSENVPLVMYSEGGIHAWVVRLTQGVTLRLCYLIIFGKFVLPQTDHSDATDDALQLFALQRRPTSIPVFRIIKTMFPGWVTE